MKQPPKPTIKISVVDDHQLFRQGLINIIHQIDRRFEVISDAANGKTFLEQLEAGKVPDIVVMDLNMPVMDGHKTTIALKEKYPQTGVLVLTMMEDEISLIRLLKAGVNGYLNKDTDPVELKEAITSIAENGYYYTEHLAGKLVNVIRQPANQPGPVSELSEQELRFIELSCSEHTYKMIADEMCLSIKTVDGYRSKLFDKLQVRSRVGLVMYALRNKIVSLDHPVS